MSDISISFPPRMIAWFLLGEATPFITLVLIILVAAFFFSRANSISTLRRSRADCRNASVVASLAT